MKVSDVVQPGDEVFCGPCGQARVVAVDQRAAEMAVRLPSGVQLWLPLDCLCAHSVPVVKGRRASGRGRR